MSRQQAPPFVRKPSAPWDRLRPIKQDPLESMGYVSKGDNRLLDAKVQESFYHKIVARYMQFCTRHSKDLDNAFASLSLGDETVVSADLSGHPSVGSGGPTRPTSNTTSSKGLSASRWATDLAPAPPAPAPADELSTILMALRKLREGLLATSSTSLSPVFSQRVHVFNIRVAILALHPPSYHPSLSYLLAVLHTKECPLPFSELQEMTTYMILDLALRQNDLIAAFTLYHNSKRHFDYENQWVNSILRAVVTSNWVTFWRIRRQVDGYMRAMMHWHIDTLRKAALKSIGRAYMKADVRWVLKSSSGGDLSWEELVAKEAVGWLLEDENVVIRKPRLKA